MLCSQDVGWAEGDEKVCLCVAGPTFENGERNNFSALASESVSTRSWEWGAQGPLSPELADLCCCENIHNAVLKALAVAYAGVSCV